MSLNPWLALILGVLFGWFFGWLLERWFFRRRRAECEEQLTRVEGEWRAQEDALSAARAQVGALEADIASLKLAAEAPKVEVELPHMELPDVELEAPKVAVELPEVKLPDVDIEAPKVQLGATLPGVELPDVEFEAPKVEVELPEVKLPDVDIEVPKVELGLPEVALPGLEVEAPQVDVELPDVRLPDVELEAPKLEAELPDVELPDVKLEGLKGKVTGGLAAIGAGLAGLAGRGRLEGGEVELPDVELEAPKVEVELPEVKLPDIDIEAPKVELGLPEVALPGLEVEAPKLEAELPDVELPDVKLEGLKGKVTGGLAAIGAGLAGLAGRGRLEGGEVELPDVELEAPKVEVELPEVKLPDIDIEAPKVELGLPEVALPGLEVEAPDLEVELPDVKLPDIEVEAPKVQLGATLPGVALPDVELEAPKAEVDWPALSAEVGEAAVDLPEVSVAAPSIGAELPEVEIGLPGASVEALAPTFGAKADDLTLIKGIGPKFAAQLSAAGITSFAALAAADPAQLKATIDAPEWRQTDYGAWVAEAQRLAVAPPEAAGDDLTRLEGIGPVYAGKLNAAGITSFAALADTDEARLAEIIAAPDWRKVNYGEWIEQARLAAAEDEAGLAKLQARLFRRKSDNLALVSGVGAKTAQALDGAGITSFAALAAATPERLAEITRTAGVRGGDFDAWIAEAGLRAAGKRISKPKRTRAAQTTSCPQDLSRIKGIGSAFETKLYAAGIGTFWQVSQTDAEALAQILEVKDFQKVDLDAIKADALRLAQETGTRDRTWDGTPPDDFEPLEGIGEVYEGRLYDAGICTYRALAEATVEQLAEICKAPEWRQPDYASWIAQAKRLLAE